MNGLILIRRYRQMQHKNGFVRKRLHIPTRSTDEICAIDNSLAIWSGNGARRRWYLAPPVVSQEITGPL